jgi:hypothetical protein
MKYLEHFVWIVGYLYSERVIHAMGVILSLLWLYHIASYRVLPMLDSWSQTKKTGTGKAIDKISSPDS